MKKNLIVLLLCSISFLCACQNSGGPIRGDDISGTGSTSEPISTFSVSIASETKNQYELFQAILDDSKPNIVKTRTTYAYPEGNYFVELASSSELRIEYGETIKAQYTLTKEVLNDSLDGDFKKTVTKTYYIYGDSLGTLKEDGTVDWENSTSSSLLLLRFNLNYNYFVPSTVDFSNGFSGQVQNGAESFFLGSEELDGQISSLLIDIRVNSTRVTDVYSSFYTAQNAFVKSSSSFIYVPVTVDMPL